MKCFLGGSIVSGKHKTGNGKNNLLNGDFSIDLYDSKEIIIEFGFLMTSEFPFSYFYELFHH